MNEPTISLTVTGDFLPVSNMASPLPMRAVLSWSIYEPHIVRADITNSDQTVTWEFDRQMIAQGLETDGLIGWKHGDVMVGGRKNSPAFVFRLACNTDMETYVRIPRADVDLLVALSIEECAMGSEKEQLILGNIVEEMIEEAQGWTL